MKLSTSRVQPYTRVVDVSSSASALAEGPCDAIMIDSSALPSPSAIVVTMDGRSVTFFNLTPGVIYPFRVTHVTDSAGLPVKVLYY